MSGYHLLMTTTAITMTISCLEKSNFELAFPASFFWTDKNHSGRNYSSRKHNVQERDSKGTLSQRFHHFCLPKDVASGNYNYANRQHCLVKNNIKKSIICLWKWNFLLDWAESWNNQGSLPLLSQKSSQTCSGLKVDWEEKNSLNSVHNSFEFGPYPIVCVNMTNFGDKFSWVIPFLNNRSCLNKNNDLNITMSFSTNGSKSGVTYYTCLFYTDTNITLDLR